MPPWPRARRGRGRCTTGRSFLGAPSFLYRPRTPGTLSPMRVTRWTLVALALAVRAAPAGAQDERPRRAFEPAVTLSASVTLFGQRSSDPFGTFNYKNSAGVGVWGELPLTRRTGLLALATFSPLSGQRQEQENNNSLIDDDVLSLAVDVGLGARLKPAVPVFFLVGAGVHTATRYAKPQSD